ncbi:hypothetical protein [Thermosipho globiformans]|uniref:hypothetical protein n=1 Tax=Thermosipho globiformans TaxID=380685 RepID=UPI000F8E756A|nr:hypothetical protein [Thermosipho globiformans]
MRRRRRNTGWIWIVLVLVIIAGVVGAFFWKVYSVKNSEEFNLSYVSQYLFIDKSNEEGFYVIVNGSKRTVNILKIKNHTFDPRKKQEINFSSPILALKILGEMFNVDSSYKYYVVVDSGKIASAAKKLNINASSFDELFNVLSERGLKIFDFFKLNSILKELRPETTLNAPSIAKLIYSLGNFSVRFKDIPTLTKRPLSITVGDSTFERIYIDTEKIQQLKNDIGG